MQGAQEELRKLSIFFSRLMAGHHNDNQTCISSRIDKSYDTDQDESDQASADIVIGEISMTLKEFL